MKNLKLLFAIASFFSIGVMAQPICKIRTFSTDNGLPASVVSGMTQSSDNLLWIASWNGLSCYDGYRFTTFRNIPGQDSQLTTNHLISVLPAFDGNLWVVAYTDDIYLFDSRTCQYTNISAIIAKKSSRRFHMRKIYPLANGDAWVAGKDTEHYQIIRRDKIDGSCIVNVELPGKLNKVMLDAWGNEWLLTTKGAYVQRKGEHKLSFVTRHNINFIEECNGALWLASTDGALLRLDKNRNKPIAVALTTKITGINGLLLLKNGRLAIATAEGLLIYDTRSGKEKLLSMQWPANPMPEVTKIFADSRQRIWCFNKGSGVMMVTADFQAHRLSVPKGDQRLTVADRPIFHEDNRHTIWLAPISESFSYYDEKTKELVPQPLTAEGAKDRYIPRIKKSFSDHQGNLWLIYPHNLSLVSFSYSNVLEIDLGTRRDTRAVLQDHNGDIILGAVDGDIVKYSSKGMLKGYLSVSGEWKRQKTKFMNHIYSLYEDKRKRLWIGTKGYGLYCVDNGHVTSFLHDEALPYSISKDQIYDIKEDTRGRLLVATFEGGLNISATSIYGNEKLQDLKFVHSGNLLAGYDLPTYKKVRRIEVLPDGVVLVATTGGLLSYSDKFSDFKKIRFFSSCHTADKESLFSSEVMQTLRTPNGDIYVVTLGGGLQKISSRYLLQDNLRFEPIFNKGERMVNLFAGYGTMQSLVADNNGSVWVIGENRIACISKDELCEYGSDELGFVNLTEALPSHSATSDRIVLATEGGALSFVPKQMERSNYRPKIVYTSVRYMDQDDEHPILNNPKLTVDVDHRSFSLFFSALDYTMHSANGVDGRVLSAIRYAYRIDDEDKWIYVHPGSNSISFNHFPAGTHVISVKSTNGDGVWMDNERKLTIYAEPTFLESWFGKLIITFLAASLVAFCIKVYMRKRTVEITEEATEKADAGKVRYMLRNPEVVDEDKLFMDKLLAYIEEHIADADMKVDDMAIALSMGRSSFYAKLKQIADMSPNDFLRHIRMGRAEELIVHSNMPFSQIAYATGFSDPKYFGKCFKKQTGMSPSEYRKLKKQTNLE